MQRVDCTEAEWWCWKQPLLHRIEQCRALINKAPAIANANHVSALDRPGCTIRLLVGPSNSTVHSFDLDDFGERYMSVCLDKQSIMITMASPQGMKSLALSNDWAYNRTFITSFFDAAITFQEAPALLDGMLAAIQHHTPFNPTLTWDNAIQKALDVANSTPAQIKHWSTTWGSNTILQHIALADSLASSEDWEAWIDVLKSTWRHPEPPIGLVLEDGLLNL